MRQSTRGVLETRLLLIRHAHVETGRLCGWLDLPLSPEGQAQLQISQPQLPPPSPLYASPLLRTRTTAEALSRWWNVPLRLEPGLREIHCGLLEGLPIEQLRRDYPELWSRNDAQSDIDFAWPGGESYRQFRARVLETLGRIAACHPGDRVVVVTHTGVISQCIGAMQGLSPAAWGHFRPQCFSASEVLWRGKGPEQLLSFNRQQWWQG